MIDNEPECRRAVDKNSDLEKLRRQLYKETLMYDPSKNDIDKIECILSEMDKYDTTDFSYADTKQMLERGLDAVRTRELKEKFRIEFKNAIKEEIIREYKSRPFAKFKTAVLIIFFVVMSVTITVNAAFGINIFSFFFGERSGMTTIECTTGDKKDTDDDSNISQNPSIVSEPYNTLEEAIDTLSIKPVLPEYIPNNLLISNISIMSGESGYYELNYSYYNDKDELVIHFQIKHLGNVLLFDETPSITTDYNLVDEITINEMKYSVLSDGYNFQVNWSQNPNMIYRMSTTLNLDEIKKIIGSIK